MKNFQSYRRRSILKQAASMTLGMLSFPMINMGAVPLSAAGNKKYSTRALDLVAQSFNVDLKHALSLYPKTVESYLTNPDSFTEEIWLKFKDSGLSVIQTTVETIPDTLHDYALHNSFLASKHDYFKRIDSVDDFNALPGSGKIGMILGSEDSSHFKTLDDIDRFYQLGQRVSQLTYNSRNLIGSGATERSDGGLSDYGLKVVEKMNITGMAIDISHCGDQTSLDALSLSQSPVLITHSVARSLNPSHPRTKSDEAIRLMAKTGGVMGIGFLRVFIRDREPTTIEHALDHFDHVIKLVGIEHVAIGSDIALYGYDALPRAYVNASKANLKPGSYKFREKDDIEGLNHPLRLFDLTEGFIRRGYSDSEIAMILGGNAKRVLTAAWTNKI
jgi:membrane dipeptidase